ncbi:MAG TPA: TrmH family RNA methyltransferase [Anaerolineae bacterium]
MNQPLISYRESPMPQYTWLEGIISIEAALRAGSREVAAIYVQRDRWTGNILRLRKTAESAGISWEQVKRDFIEERASGASHGGVIALAGPRRFTTMEQLVSDKERPLVVMLDGIEDPFNFGQAVRALYSAGADGLVVRPRNWLSAAGIVARSSAGASELMPMAVAESAEEAADFYRRRSLIVACTTRKASVSIYQADLSIPLFLLLGGEKRGITRSFVDKADLRLQIPYRRPFPQSLGAAASAAIIAFEIMRQRMTVGL